MKLQILGGQTCGACKQLAMLLQTRFADRVKDIEIEWVIREEDTAKFNDLAEKYGARSIPFVIFEDKGHVITPPGPKQVEDFLTNTLGI